MQSRRPKSIAAKSIEQRANYILFSDVHLGADLVQFARPWTLSRLKQAARIDRYLVSMLEYYRRNADPALPWRLIIAGDLVDFIGMSIAPKDGEPVELTEEEREHGLGSSEDAAVIKMQAVAVRHRAVFEALGNFVAEGHSIVLIRGNHDVDFHWDKARDAFVEAVVSHIPMATEAEQSVVESLRSRVEFYPWFYYVEGLLYVEHGHQYDELCTHEELLAPLSYEDPKRTHYSLSDVLLRFIVRPTPGMDAEGHEHATALHYLRLARRLGLRGGLKLALRYISAIKRAVRTWRMHVRKEAAVIRAEHERRMAEVAIRMRIGRDKLKTLADMAARPITRELAPIVRLLFLERVALGFFGAILFTLLFSMHAPIISWLGTTFLFGGMSFQVYRWSSRSRVLDASDALRRGAAQVAALLPAQFIVMGHTHQPKAEWVQNGAMYVNLGNWGVDDLDEHAANKPDAPCTHLVIRHIEGKAHAEFYRWDPVKGLIAMPLPKGTVPPPEKT